MHLQELFHCLSDLGKKDLLMACVDSGRINLVQNLLALDLRVKDYLKDVEYLKRACFLEKTDMCKYLLDYVCNDALYKSRKEIIDLLMRVKNVDVLKCIIPRLYVNNYDMIYLYNELVVDDRKALDRYFYNFGIVPGKEEILVNCIKENDFYVLRNMSNWINNRHTKEMASCNRVGMLNYCRNIGINIDTYEIYRIAFVCDSLDTLIFLDENGYRKKMCDDDVRACTSNGSFKTLDYWLENNSCPNIESWIIDSEDEEMMIRRVSLEILLKNIRHIKKMKYTKVMNFLADVVPEKMNLTDFEKYPDVFLKILKRKKNLEGCLIYYVQNNNPFYVEEILKAENMSGIEVTVYNDNYIMADILLRYGIRVKFQINWENKEYLRLVYKYGLESKERNDLEYFMHAQDEISIQDPELKKIVRYRLGFHERMTGYPGDIIFEVL